MNAEQKKSKKTFDLKNRKIIIKKNHFLFVLLFTSLLINSQSTDNNQSTTKMDYQYGTNIKVNINEEIQFEDGLSILLKYFTHKHPYVNGPTKATAYIILSKNKLIEEESLSIHGIEGKPDIHYDSLLWDKYEFHLKVFNYNESIEIIITERK
ncbi:hypothetical protein [uncultured Aquimarina sp.]|uniref:hypothetical protein n=1 Tax=uncultured Aquimarina sp. TaxID=575652 RepID=UPI0026046598|nr:hypothetical protein [uncultured Aquimarina sp.]